MPFSKNQQKPAKNDFFLLEILEYRSYITVVRMCPKIATLTFFPHKRDFSHKWFFSTYAFSQKKSHTLPAFALKARSQSWCQPILWKLGIILQKWLITGKNIKNNEGRISDFKNNNFDGKNPLKYLSLGNLLICYSFFPVSIGSYRSPTTAHTIAHT